MKIHIQYVFRDDSLVGEFAALGGSNTREVEILHWNRSNVIKACVKLAEWNDKSLKKALDKDNEDYFYHSLLNPTQCRSTHHYLYLKLV